MRSLLLTSRYLPLILLITCGINLDNSSDWKTIKTTFYADNEDIKNATRELIDTSFRKLRSAEGACELLQSFKSIK